MDETKKYIQQIIREELDHQAKMGSFTDRKVTDTPTDDLSIANRRYVNMNGSVASRPASTAAIIGQKYFAVDTNQLMVYGTNSKWYNGAGSVVATN